MIYLKKIFNSIKNRGFFTTVVLCFGTLFYKIFRLLFFDNFLKLLNVKSNLIVFDSFPDFSDNSLYLYNYYKTCNNNYKFIWLVSNKKNINMDSTIFIKRNSRLHLGPSLKALYYCSIASKIFYTHGSPTDSLNIKNSQLVINLWHGCGYKKDNSNGPRYIEKNYFDYVLVPGNVFVDTKSDFFGCSKDAVLPIGYPRYDQFIFDSPVTNDFIKSEFYNNRIVLWMPTFRKTLSYNYPEENINAMYDLPLLDSTEDLIKINDICFNNNVYLIIKRHPYQLNYVAEKEKFSNIKFIDNDYLNDNRIELYSLLKYTSALITDYSSVAVDFLLINKPIAFLLGDFEEYNKARGFVFENPLDYMPGHHVFNKDDLFKFFEDVVNDRDPYKSKRDEIFDQLHNKCGNYCERIVNEVDRLQKEKERGNSYEKI